MEEDPAMACGHAFKASVLLVSLLSLPLQGQTEEERRMIAVNVVDAEGKEVPGLAVANFRGEFRGQRVSILSVVPDTSPRRIAIIVDTSGSVGAPGRESGFAWDAAEDLVDGLAPGQSVALFTLGGTLHRQSPLTENQRVLKEALAQGRSQEPGGPSAIYDGMVEASQGFSSPGFADVVYVISDGEDTASQLRESDATIALARTGVRIFAIRLPGSSRLASAAAHYWTRSIADATGGYAAGPEGHQMAAKRLRAFYPLITSVYRLEVAFPRAVDKPRKWNLEVTDAVGKKLNNVQLVYPHLLVPSSHN